MTKRALLVAVTSNEPNMIDSHISCRRFKECITKHCGFLPQNICTIIDDKDSKPNEVNRDAILRQLRYFRNLTKAGDVLLFYYNGHGFFNQEGNPALLTSDRLGITGDELQQVVAEINRRNAVFTIIADCCHSGGLLKYAYEQIGHSVVDRGEMQRQGILLSACQLHEVALGSIEFGSIFTEYLIQIIAEANGRITYWDLITKVQLILSNRGTLQTAGLYCTTEEAHSQIFEHI